MAGEFHPIPIDEHVISLTRWAVDEYNKKQNTQLEFRGVWSVQVQLVVRIVAGNNYQIVLDAAFGPEINKYEAEVFVALTGDKVLGDFTPLLKA